MANGVTSTAFWSIVSIVAAAIGGLFFVITGHANEERHPGAANEEKVASLEVKVERVATKVDHNKDILEEVKQHVKEIRIEQNAYNQSVLEAIERSNR